MDLSILSCPQPAPHHFHSPFLSLRFGPGPHRVELEIEYPKFDNHLPATEWPRVRGVFLIELAPLDKMPVTIHMFLQQVRHKLWNGAAFAINAGHILQAGPHQYNNGTYIANHDIYMDKFIQANLHQLPFQEYHQEYPHQQWTLGYAGRPAGPDFYINKIDNSENHGPGGQLHHDLHEEADPCFGKLLRGMDLIDDINKLPIDEDRHYAIKEHVLIVDARVVMEERHPRDGAFSPEDESIIT
jgi:cyclophilin family peptidyl-prolyl cis-trans isomerase